MSGIGNASDRATTAVFGLVGAGGFAREVMPLVREHFHSAAQAAPELKYKLFFVETEPHDRVLNGYPVISLDEFLELECSKKFFNVAIGNSRTRGRIADDCIAEGALPLSIQCRSAIAYDNNEIGEGAILCAYTMVTSNAKIGKFFHANIYSYVAHDCLIGDYVTFGPDVHCNGNVHIHDHAYIGTGAMIKQGSPGNPVVIGEGAVVGMGAVVTKSVSPHTTVVGNPARPHNRP